MNVAQVLTLPGWHGSGADHWQAHWEALYGYRRVEQHDWERPLRGDWNAQLEEAVLACGEAPIVLVAHSLGCALVANWVRHSSNVRRVRAALLVAPADTEHADLRVQLHGWSPMPLHRLPFISTVIASRNDPYCDIARAQTFATAWGAALADVGPFGHLNADSALGAWPQGHAYLREAAGAAGVSLTSRPSASTTE